MQGAGTCVVTVYSVAHPYTNKQPIEAAQRVAKCVWLALAAAVGCSICWLAESKLSPDKHKAENTNSD